MTTILYIHGFASSGASGTPQMLRQMLYEQGVRVLSPDVPVMPAEAFPFLQNLVAVQKPDLIIGTSMGAFYAEQLRNTLRILVNPSFQMARLLTFRGMGRRDFLNKREDGAKDFNVDIETLHRARTSHRKKFLVQNGASPQLFPQHHSRIDRSGLALQRLDNTLRGTAHLSHFARRSHSPRRTSHENIVVTER